MPVTPLRTTSPMVAGVILRRVVVGRSVGILPAGISMLAVICSTESCTVRVASSRRFSSMGGSPRSSSASAASKAASCQLRPPPWGAAAVASCSAGALSSAGVSGSAWVRLLLRGFLRCLALRGWRMPLLPTGSVSLFCRFGGGISAAAVATASSAGAVSAGARLGLGLPGAVSGAAWAGMLSFFLLICTLPKNPLGVAPSWKKQAAAGPGCTQ